MPLQIADTSFTSGPDNKAVAVDVYKTPPQRPTNTTPGIVGDGVAGSFGNLAFGGTTVSGLLKDVAKGFATNGQVDFDGALNRAAGITNTAAGALRSRGGMATDEILKGFGFYNSELGKNLDAITKGAGGDSFSKLVQGGSKTIEIMSGNFKTDLKKLKDLNSLQNLSDLIAGVSGDNEFIKIFNLSDTLSVFKSLNKVAVEFSLPGVMDKLISKLDDKEKKKVVVGSARDQYAVSDLSYVETMLQHASPEELLGNNPNLLKDILANFRTSAAYPDSDLVTAQKLDNVLKRFRPLWMYTFLPNQAQQVFDLDLFKVASPFARECFLTHDMYVVPLAISSSYDIIPFTKTVNGKYPYLNWA